MNRFLLVIVSACALLACSAAYAQETAPDPKAIVEQAGEFLQKQEKFSLDASMSMKITSPAANQESSASFKITLVRPNQLAMVANAGELAASIYSDGENLVTYHQSLNKYLVETAPENVGQFTEKEGGQIFAGPGGFLLNVLSPNPAESLLEGTTDAKYVGKEEIRYPQYVLWGFYPEKGVIAPGETEPNADTATREAIDCAQQSFTALQVFLAKNPPELRQIIELG